MTIPRIQGTVVGVKNHGSIVEVVVQVTPDRTEPVYLEHRCFRDWAEAMGNQVLGLEITAEGDPPVIYVEESGDDC